MTTNVLQLASPIDEGKERVIKLLEAALASAKKGETTGILILHETSAGFNYSRANMRLETAIALCARVGYRLNQEWDAV